MKHESTNHARGFQQVGIDGRCGCHLAMIAMIAMTSTDGTKQLVLGPISGEEVSILDRSAVIEAVTVMQRWLREDRLFRE